MKPDPAKPVTELNVMVVAVDVIVPESVMLVGFVSPDNL
jgi:hypothetical protein